MKGRCEECKNVDMENKKKIIWGDTDAYFCKKFKEFVFIDVCWNCEEFDEIDKE